MIVRINTLIACKHIAHTILWYIETFGIVSRKQERDACWKMIYARTENMNKTMPATTKMPEPKEQFISVADLRIGLFVYIDLGWISHPFPLNSFKISSTGADTPPSVPWVSSVFATRLKRVIRNL